VRCVGWHGDLTMTSMRNRKPAGLEGVSTDVLAVDAGGSVVYTVPIKASPSPWSCPRH
jgi:hypothetical protein